jgi:hypothetical protein
MTLTEKILAKHSDNTRLQPGANIWTNVDKLLTHDVCGPGTFGIFEKEFGAGAQVWDPEKVIIIPDHYIFTSDPRANRNVDILRQVSTWATQYSSACVACWWFSAPFPILVYIVNNSTLLYAQLASRILLQVQAHLHVLMQFCASDINTSYWQPQSGV